MSRYIGSSNGEPSAWKDWVDPDADERVPYDDEPDDSCPDCTERSQCDWCAGDRIYDQERDRRAEELA